MTDRTLVDRLLDEVQEEYDFDGVLPLYMFAWSLAGLGMDRSDPEFVTTCRMAYDTFVERLDPGVPTPAEHALLATIDPASIGATELYPTAAFGSVPDGDDG